MGKKKSALLLVLYTLLLALLCVICTVSFNYGTNGLYRFSSILELTDKDADLGGEYGANGSYGGGGYSTVYYPEGVISAKEYQDDLGGIADEAERADYEAKYRAYANGTLYLEVGTACNEEGEALASFSAAFDAAVEKISDRYERLHTDGARVSVRDDYTVEVFLPQMMENEYYAVSRFAFTGELSRARGAVRTVPTVRARPPRTICTFTSAIRRSSRLPSANRSQTTRCISAEATLPKRRTRRRSCSIPRSPERRTTLPSRWGTHCRSPRRTARTRSCGCTSPSGSYSSR